MRRVKALAMRFARNCSEFASLCALPRIMKNKAAAKLPKMATNASATRKFMILLSLDSNPMCSTKHQRAIT